MSTWWQVLGTWYQVLGTKYFSDGTPTKRKDEVKYLGCMINQESNYKIELGKRIRETMETLNKLNVFWLHSNCSMKFKLIAADAVIRAKVMYGLDSAQLAPFPKIIGSRTKNINRYFLRPRLLRCYN